MTEIKGIYRGEIRKIHTLFGCQKLLCNKHVLRKVYPTTPLL